MSTQLPFTGTLSVIPFKKKKNKNTVLISTIVGFYTRLTIMAMQVPFKKALAQSFARHCCSSKKQIYTV